MTPKRRQAIEPASITSLGRSPHTSSKAPDPFASALAIYIAKLSPPAHSLFKGGYVLNGTTPFLLVKTDDPHSTDFHLGFCTTSSFRTVCIETNQADNKDKYLPRALEKSQLNDLAHDLRDIILELEEAIRQEEETYGITNEREGKWKLTVVLKMIPFDATQYYCKDNVEKLQMWENVGKPKGLGSMYTVIHLELSSG